MRGRLLRCGVACAAAALLCTLLTSAAPAAGPAAGDPTPAVSAPTNPVALLAYYYIWFDTTSWDRAKLDYPSLGRYSSGDVTVIRQQVAWAKSAGINGFLVSWKNTPTNNRRLRLLMQVAREQQFKLAMIYQGLDFSRRAQPVARVAADFVVFRDSFAADPVFLRLGGKPLTVFSGTWAFSPAAVATVTGPVRGALQVLATEKSAAGFRRLATVTDGDAYYWSSVNPDTYPDFGAKLANMSAAIHQDGKYWVAPFAPGFDARMVGGALRVDRKDGQTLQRQYAAAVSSSPDVLGLISWNEFSENSYVEPSQRYGTRYLDVLRALTHASVPVPASAADSSEAAPPGPGRPWGNLVLLAGFPAILAAGVGALAVVRRRLRPIYPRPPHKGVL